MKRKEAGPDVPWAHILVIAGAVCGLHPFATARGGAPCHKVVVQQPDSKIKKRTRVEDSGQ